MEATDNSQLIGNTVWDIMQVNNLSDDATVCIIISHPSTVWYLTTAIWSVPTVIFDARYDKLKISVNDPCLHDCLSKSTYLCKASCSYRYVHISAKPCLLWLLHLDNVLHCILIVNDGKCLEKGNVMCMDVTMDTTHWQGGKMYFLQIFSHNY